MVRKKKLKPIEVDRATYDIMVKIWGHGKVPYNPTVINKKEEKEDESE